MITDKDIIESFESKIIYPTTEINCWIWGGNYRNKKGDRRGYYGEFRYKDIIRTGAHQASYLIYKGDILKGLCVCHTCDNSQCVNPDHLFLDTTRGNTRDRYLKGRSAKGSGHGRTHLTESDIPIIRALGAHKSLREIGELYKMDPSTIGDIVNYRSWKHVP